MNVVREGVAPLGPDEVGTVDVTQGTRAQSGHCPCICGRSAFGPPWRVCRSIAGKCRLRTIVVGERAGFVLYRTAVLEHVLVQASRPSALPSGPFA